MNDTWYAIIGGIVTTIASSFVSWFFAKRKYNAEVDNHLISNMQESLEFYKALADDNKVRLESVLQENAELRKEIGEVRCENAELRQGMNEMRMQIQSLTSALAKYGLHKLIDNNEPEEQ